MTAAEFPTLAEELKRHRPSMLRSYPARCRCKQEYTDWDEHLDAAWFEACTIRTREVLDVLPVGAVVMSLWDYSPHYTAVQHTDGWVAQGSWNIVFPLGSGSNGETVLLLWHPDWAKR